MNASRDGYAVRITAQATLKAPLQIVWQTLTDYERLPEFIPGMHKSKVIGHRGAAAIVTQLGEAHLLMFSYPIEVTVASVHLPPYEIQIHLLEGNLKQLDGGYQIEPRPDGSLILHWTGLIEPSLTLPPLIREYLMRATVEEQFLGMVREIERREGSQTRR